MRRFIFALIVGMVGFVACVTHQPLRPIYPQAQVIPEFPTPVNSLQPILKWKPLSEPNVSYDVIIYEGVRVQIPHYFLGTKLVERYENKLVTGKMIYYREGIKEPQHRIEEPLKPNAEYFWSLRARKGDIITPWSTLDYSVYYGIGGGWGRNVPFTFKTPDSE
jgi:hypothetical protein